MSSDYFIFTLLSLAMLWNFIHYVLKRVPGEYNVILKALIFQIFVSVGLISYGAALIFIALGGAGEKWSIYFAPLFIISGIIGIVHAILQYLDSRNRIR